MLNVLHTEWSEGWGGQEMRILLEAKGLLERGYKVSILCSPGSHIAKEGLRHGMLMYLMNMKHAFDVSALWKMARLMKENAVTVVNTHSSVDSWIASFAAKIANVPVLVRTRHLSVPISKHFLNFVYRMPDAIITTGEAIRQMMIEENRLNGKDIVSIPTGIMLTRFRPDISGQGVREEYGIKSCTSVVTIVAALRSWKRHEIFLEASSEVLKAKPSTIFLIVGDGPRQKAVKEKITELGLTKNVIMTGYREDIPEILAASDVCALTSDSAEGVPQAVLQYLAMKKPVVATNAGSISEVVRHCETGLLAEANNPKSVANGILRMFQDDNLAKALGKNGRALVERYYDHETMLDRTTELYAAVYERKMGRGGMI